VSLAVPVYNTHTGKPITTNITRELVDCICVHPVFWEAATSFKASHMVDFGPGGQSGVGGLTHRNREGTGVKVISPLQIIFLLVV
jgi:malonyl CoA-acyl carrier protein transacylase